MKIVILGGRGFIGRCLTTELLACGHQLRVFDRPDTQAEVELRALGVDFVSGDFTNHGDLNRAVADCEVVFHLLSTTLPKSANDDPLHDVITNIAGTVYLLELLRQQKGVRLVFASSGGTVYGIPRQLPISETHPMEPICAYGVSKLTVEKYLSLYHTLHGLDYRILRLANAYGEGQSPMRGQGAINVFAYKALRNEAIAIWGDGSVIRDYVHVHDVVRALTMAMSDNHDERVFNIGSGCGHSLNELLDALEATLRRPVKRVYERMRAFDVPANVLDCRQAEAVLGWRPNISLQAGFERTLAWLSNHYSLV